MLRRALHAHAHAFKTCNVRCISSLTEAVSQGAPVDVHPEVEHALQSGAPVVALETTIVTHGMPQPTNLNTARSVESIVRAQGAVPATMGIIGGRIKIGLHPHELEYLADVKNNPAVVKVSRRDLGPAIALKRDGGTTCSTTLMFSAMAGIKVFATGGLGGVHRGGETTMDVSADLPELTRCPVGLVSAGVKSILDIGRTLEYLETLGVPVVSYGQTDDFPAFYSRKSGFKSPWRVDNPTAAADILHSQRQLGLSTGAIFAVPIPEEYEAVGQELQEAVQQALKEAEEQGVHKWGKAATPWLLKRVGELTAGKSLASNVALIENTARVGGQIAVAYAARNKQDSGLRPQPAIPVQYTTPATRSIPQPEAAKPERASSPSPVVPEKAELMIIGSAAVDITSQACETDPSLAAHSTVPGGVTVSLGGVGRNVAEAAHRILSSYNPSSSASSVLLSPVGDDAFGRLLVEETGRLGMRTDGLLPLKSQRSAVCNMVLDGNGNLLSGVADMDIIMSLNDEVVLQRLKTQQPALTAVDGNLSEETLKIVVRTCYDQDVATFFEPTSVTKSARILPGIASLLSSCTASHRAPVTFASPNLLELAHLYKTVTSDALEMTSHTYWWQTVDAMGLGSEFRMDLEHLARREACEAVPAKGALTFLLDEGVAQMAVNLLPFFQHLVVKAGDKGLFTVFRLTPAQAKQSVWAGERTNIRERCVVAHGRDGSVVVFKHYPAIVLRPEDVVNVTGAGDTLVGTILASLVRTPQAFEAPRSLNQLVELAQKAAILTLQSPLAVSPKLSSLQ